MRIKTVSLVLGLFVMVVGALWSVLGPVPQAKAQTACSEAPVNVQFRQYTGTETSWLEGAGFAPVVNSAIDVNCFSRNGGSLLTGGKLTATRTYGGVTTNISVSTWAREIRNYRITLPGVYTFTCRNTAGSCTNSDTFTVIGPSPSPIVNPSPTPSPALSPTPSPTPATVVSTCNSITVDGGVTPTVGQKIKFRCNGPSNAGTHFFSYRRSNTEGLVQLPTAAGNLSTEIEVSPFMQVQCNPCIGTTCATADNVNQNCTYTFNQPVTPSPAAGSKADLNKDGKVDILDYQIFLEEYLKFAK